MRASTFPRVAARHDSALLGFSRFLLELSQAPYVTQVVIAKSHDVIRMRHKRNRITEAVKAQPLFVKPLCCWVFLYLEPRLSKY